MIMLSAPAGSVLWCKEEEESNPLLLSKQIASHQQEASPASLQRRTNRAPTTAAVMMLRTRDMTRYATLKVSRCTHCFRETRRRRRCRICPSPSSEIHRESDFMRCDAMCRQSINHMLHRVLFNIYVVFNSNHQSINQQSIHPPLTVFYRVSISGPGK